MAKRRSEYQINHNNWDEECEQEEGGNFQQAGENVLKNRVIRVAKRRIQRDQVDTGDTAKNTTSVFSGFSFEKSACSTTNASSTASSTKPLFGFGNTSSTPFSLASNLATPMSSAVNSIGSSATIAAKSEKSQTFKAKLKELNKSVLKCVKGYVESESLCILTPIFKDYDKFVKEIEDEERKAMISTISIATTASATPIKNANNDSTQFKFSFNSAKSTEQSASASSATATPSMPANSFSFKPASTPSTFSGFSFASAVQQSAKPANANASENGEKNTKDGENEDEEDQPPVVEFVPVVEEESIYSKRCKVFVKDESAAFKDRGTGTLYMKQVADDKVQLIVRADTNLGNILLNIIISKGIPAKRTKNNLILVCIPTPDADPKPRQVLVRVAKEDDAIELLEEYEKHQK